MQPVEREIRGVIFVVKPLTFVEGRSALVRLQQVCGPALGELVGGGAKGGGVARAITEISARLTEKELAWFCDKFAATTSVRIPDERDGTGYREPAFDKALNELFAGRFTFMLEWLEFCIEVNFGDFLEKLGKLVVDGQARLQALSQSKFPQDLIGKSGESSQTADSP